MAIPILEFASSYLGPERRSAGRRDTDLSAEQQAGIAQAFVMLAEARRDGRSQADHLELLIDLCRALEPDAEMSVVLRGSNGALELLASTSNLVKVIDELQIDDPHGPLQRTVDQSEGVLEISLVCDESLPKRFATLATRSGLCYLHAIPLNTGNEVIGVLNIYSHHDEPIRTPMIAWLSAIAYCAALAVDSVHSHEQLSVLADQLQAALNSRAIIEQAKGAVGAKLAVDTDEAFALMRRYARGHRLRIHEVCNDIVQNRISVFVLRAERRHIAIGTPAPGL
jgi:transcriptional regulator with GAF, ATPase, and Fis domain